MSDPKAYKEYLDRFQAANSGAPALNSSDPAAIAEHVAKHAPAGTAQIWLKELFALNAPAARGPRYGVIALGLAGLLVGAALINGIFFQPAFLTTLATEGNARGLITFLFAIATIAVILVTIIATFWVSADEVEKRGAMAKEILTILIGIMGTILGFYFGSQVDAPAPEAPSAVEQPAR